MFCVQLYVCARLFFLKKFCFFARFLFATFTIVVFSFKVGERLMRLLRTLQVRFDACLSKIGQNKLSAGAKQLSSHKATRKLTTNQNNFILIIQIFASQYCIFINLFLFLYLGLASFRCYSSVKYVIFRNFSVLKFSNLHRVLTRWTVFFSFFFNARF